MHWKELRAKRRAKSVQMKAVGLIKDRTKGYERIGVLTIERGLDLIRSRSEEKKLFGHIVRLKSSGNRLNTFVVSGTECKQCGAQAEYFAVERQKSNGVNPIRFHLNLWGTTKNGQPLLFTHDHIIPRACGGEDVIENCQTMCHICNENKGCVVHV